MAVCTTKQIGTLSVELCWNLADSICQHCESLVRFDPGFVTSQLATAPRLRWIYTTPHHSSQQQQQQDGFVLVAVRNWPSPRPPKPQQRLGEYWSRPPHDDIPSTSHTVDYTLPGAGQMCVDSSEFDPPTFCHSVNKVFHVEKINPPTSIRRRLISG